MNWSIPQYSFCLQTWLFTVIHFQVQAVNYLTALQYLFICIVTCCSVSGTVPCVRLTSADCFVLYWHCCIIIDYSQLQGVNGNVAAILYIVCKFMNTHCKIIVGYTIYIPSVSITFTDRLGELCSCSLTTNSIQCQLQCAYWADVHVNQVAWISTVLIQFILNVCYGHYFLLLIASNEILHYYYYILIHRANYRYFDIGTNGQICCVANGGNQGIKSQQIVHTDCVPCLFIYYYGCIPWECYCTLARQSTAKMYTSLNIHIQGVNTRRILLDQYIWYRLCIQTYSHFASTSSQWFRVIATLVCTYCHQSIFTQIVVELQLQVLLSSMNTSQTYFVPASWQLAEIIGLVVIQFYCSIATFWSYNWWLWIYYQITLALHIYVASVIFWQVFLIAFKQLFQLVDWQVLFQFINHFLQIICSKVFLALVEQHHCAAAQIRDILTILIQQLFCS